MLYSSTFKFSKSVAGSKAGQISHVKREDIDLRMRLHSNAYRTGDSRAAIEIFAQLLRSKPDCLSAIGYAA